MSDRRNISPELREYLTRKEMEKLMRAPNPRIDLTKPGPRRRETGKSIRAEPEQSFAYKPLETLDGLGDEGFMAFVFDEALDRVASQEADLLRSSEAKLAERWHWSLGQLMAKVNARLSEMAGSQHNGGQEYWRFRQKALEHKAALQERRTEIAPLAERMKRQRHEAQESERANSQEAIFAERRAAIVRAFGQMNRPLTESFDALKRSVEKLSRNPEWRRAMEAHERGES